MEAEGLGPSASLAGKRIPVQPWPPATRLTPAATPAAPAEHLVFGWSRASELRDGYRRVVPCRHLGDLLQTRRRPRHALGKSILSVRHFEWVSIGYPDPGKRLRNHQPIPRM